MPTLLADNMSIGLTAVAVLVIRMLMMPLLIYNASWSWRGFWWLIKGASFPTSVYQSVVFLMSIGMLGYHTLAFMGRTVSSWSLPWSLVLQCVFFLASILAFIGRRHAVVSQFEKFYWLFDNGNLDIAVRAAQINKLDPEYADAMLDAAENTVVLRIAKRALSSEQSS